jgi:hypothetical protein
MPINLQDPIFNNIRTASGFGQAYINQLNRSPMMVAWVAQYNQAIAAGTHEPIIPGAGQYFRPGERGDEFDGSPKPGALRIRFDNLTGGLSDPRSVGLLAHEMAHFIYINSPQGQADAARGNELIALGSTQALTPEQDAELYKLIRKVETVADYGSDVVLDSVYGPSTRDYFHSRQAVNDLGPNDLGPLDLMSAVGDRMVDIELGIMAQGGTVEPKSRAASNYISRELARARATGIPAKSIEFGSDLAEDGSRTVTVVLADGTTRSLRIFSDLTSTETVRLAGGDLTITTRAAPLDNASVGAVLSTRTETPQSDGSFNFTEQNASGGITATGSIRYFDDPEGRSSIATTNYANGSQSITTTATDYTSRTVLTPNPTDPYSTTTTDRNAAGAITSSVTVAPALDASGNPIASTYSITTRSGTGVVTSSSTRQVFDDGTLLDTQNYPDGGQALTSTGIDGSAVTRIYGADGQLTGTITTTPDGAGGSNRVVTTVVDGNAVQITQTASPAALFTGEQPGDYHTTSVTINGTPALNNPLIAGSLDDNYQSGNDIVRARGTGNLANIVTAGNPQDADGLRPSPAQVTGVPDWYNVPRIGSYAGDLTSLLAALRSGNPLPIATAGANFLSHATSDPGISDIASFLSGAGSLNTFIKGVERGDLGGILLGGSGVARSALTIFQNGIEQEIIKNFLSVDVARIAIDEGNVLAAKLIAQYDGTTELLGKIGTFITWANIINSIIKGDIQGAAKAAALYYLSTVNPYAAAIVAVVELFVSIFAQTDHQFEASGHFEVQADGSITVITDNVNGGAYVAFNKAMQGLLNQTLEQAVAVGEQYGQSMGVIAERLPVISIKQDALFLTYQDPVTGQSYTRTFDLTGRYLSPGYVENAVSGNNTIYLGPWGSNPQNPYLGRSADPADWLPGNQIANSDDFFKSIGQQFSDMMTASGAIVPQWQVDTVNSQRANGYQYAGLTPEQVGSLRDVRNDSWYGAPGDASPGNAGGLNLTSQQRVTLFALDLDHDGQITTTRKDTGLGVLFDVDNDSFAEETDWIGPRDGILVLDRTADGVPADGRITRGADLFMDSLVDGNRRGLAALQEVDGDANTPTLHGRNTTYLIAAPAMIYCAGGLKGVERRSENDDFWRGAA